MLGDSVPKALLRLNRPEGRLSRFVEELDTFDEFEPLSPDNRPRVVRFRSRSDVFELYDLSEVSEHLAIRKVGDGPLQPDYTMLLKRCPEPKQKPISISEPTPTSVSPRRLLSATLLLVFALLAMVHGSRFTGPIALDLVWIPSPGPVERIPRHSWSRRQNGATDYCTRWSQQTAVVNGTLYSYGGRASQSGDQIDNTWNNDFLTLDLTKSWDIGTPTLKSLAQPSGPPPIANGYLWHSLTSLFVYGGEYSDSPVTSPSPFALWEYDIQSMSWEQHTSPKTSSGENAGEANVLVQNSAEGAGISIASLGRGYYFGGHQDFLTTAGWSIQTARIYLKSMIEFTFPGYANKGVSGLENKASGSDGAWRNITQGGLQETHGFTERADGVLVYIPGYGKNGIILGLAGGTNDTFTQMNVIDVFDVETSTWYKQSTSGGPPPIRVNPCAVAASAADGSSANVYMYGGQNLLPYKQQTQYKDMWILTIPSFTWIEVDASTGAPPSRAGHACEIWDGQIVVMGGYVGTEITCDSPGIYVFDASNLEWKSSFNALNSGDNQSRQKSQSGSTQGLAGSYGYQVPKIVQSVIGGDGNGGATVTGPAVGATAGPLATGGPLVYTATISGQVVEQTGGTGAAPSNSNNSPNVGAIVAGVIAGILFLVACYLTFCVYIFRKQLQLYKNHVAVAQRAALESATGIRLQFSHLTRSA